MKLLEKSLEFAIKAHKGVYRKGDGRPYIFHPLAVALTLEKFKKSKNLELLMVACILHDIVEDTDITLEEIAREFGYAVAALVEELTSDPKEIERLGKTEYLKQKMTKMSSYALCIKLVDRLNNVSDLDACSQSFREKYPLETSTILEHLFKSRKLTATHQTIIAEIFVKIK